MTVDPRNQKEWHDHQRSRCTSGSYDYDSFEEYRCDQVRRHQQAELESKLLLRLQKQQSELKEKPDVGKPKRSTAKGDARAKIISALSIHHGYENGQCDMSSGSISVSGLARLADVSKSTVSKFFKDAFDGGRGEYNRTCEDCGKLTYFLQKLNNEIPPSRTHSLDL